MSESVPTAAPLPAAPLDIPAALRQLSNARTTLEKVIAPASAGIYAVYLVNQDAIGAFKAGLESVIYVGVSPSLAERKFEQHFTNDATGVSTLRRSIGAILKQKLSLKALPRTPANEAADFKNYRFQKEGEERLTQWMKTHLQVSVFASADPKLESQLLPKLRPTLNLKGWNNGQAEQIKAVRKVCADEAKASAKSKK